MRQQKLTEQHVGSNLNLLPGLWPFHTTAVVMAYTTIQSFRAFDLIYAMTQGGPNNSSSILVTLIYLTAFNEYRFGYAATQSIYLIVFILVLTAVQRRVLRTRY